MILVTGATGLVGGHLLWHLLRKNEKVIAVKRYSSNLHSLRVIFSFYTDDPDGSLNRIIWRNADMNDSFSLGSALEGVDKVYHCAAVVSMGGAGNGIIDTNVEGTKRIVDLCIERKISKFCFVSSIAACGSLPGGEQVDETVPWTDVPGRSLYSKSKYLSEQEVWKGISKGLNAVIVNPGVILGVSGNDSGSSMLFSRVKKGMPFYTAGGSGYVYVEDVVKAMIALMESDISAERFILVAENVSNREILSMISTGFNMRKPFLPVGRTLLSVVGVFSEVAGRIFGFIPLIDRGSARTATGRSFYSNRKIIRYTDIKFTPVAGCVARICRFMLKG